MPYTLHSEIIEHNGQVYRVDIEHDEFAEAPWDNCDGHGDVSDWTHRDKAPGELVLCADRGAKQFYDFAAACKTALRDGWNMAKTRKEAAAAAMQDYEYLRAWCENDWVYAVVVVTEQRTDADGYKYDGPSACLGGVEFWTSYDLDNARNEYIRGDVVQELLAEVASMHSVAA